ncbi:hypothetical protein HWV62_25076 [Athelia sp. TMB]|nr:hypothetical protein HWV62_25076 [Athelia sp. TMB]
MQTQRAPALPALNIALPHPALPHSLPLPRSIAPIARLASPRTPRTSGAGAAAAAVFFAPAPSRNSTSSWGSSLDPDDDMHTAEWTPEQALLLSRTLDALPAHLLTPFAGPLPPANLLDKIARGVAHAKGADWPHSARATRAKLVDLARSKGAAENKTARARNSIAEEREEGEGMADVTNTPPGERISVAERIALKGAREEGRRPLYRQSSMDFLKSAKLEKDEEGRSSRLGGRLRLAPHTPQGKAKGAYHPYARLNPSTPSSSTLGTNTNTNTTNTTTTNTTASWRASSASYASSSSASSSGLGLGAPVDPRVQRVRRAESFAAPSARGTLKRAPSFASPVKREGRAEAVVSPGASSDEEERVRGRGAKKARVMPARAVKAAAPAPAGSPTKKPAAKKSGEGKPRLNLQRNPSMFGAPLPALVLSPPPRAPAPAVPNTNTLAHLASPMVTAAASPHTASPMPLDTPAPAPATPNRKLRRVPRVPAEVGRRIEFGGALALPGSPRAGGGGSGSGSAGLGSAFQLH